MLFYQTPLQVLRTRLTVRRTFMTRGSRKDSSKTFHMPVCTRRKERESTIDGDSTVTRRCKERRTRGLISSLGKHDLTTRIGRGRSRTKGVTWVAPRWSLSSARIDTYSGGSPPHLPRRCWCAKVPVRIQGGGVRGAGARVYGWSTAPCACVSRVYTNPRCACAAERTREA